MGSVLVVELLGDLQGLKLAWDLGATQLILEIDHKYAIELVQEGIEC